MTHAPLIRAALTRAILATSVASVLASCATAPVPSVRREGNPAAMSGATGVAGTTAPGATGVQGEALELEATTARPQIRRGTGQVINRSAAQAPRP
ncbi:MAG: hypothetical protein ACREPE_16190, partial [Lysobacter sp.]